MKLGGPSTKPAYWKPRAAGIFGIFGCFLSEMGFHWDITAHADTGRETFWSPPHLLVIVGLVVCLAASSLALMMSPQSLREAVRSRPGMMLTFAGGIFALAVLAFDNWWHQLFGVDLLLWSPPHLLLAVAFQLMIAGTAIDLTPGDEPAWVPPLVWGAYLGAASILMLEYELGLPSYSVFWEPVSLAFFFGLGLRIARETTPLRWAGTLACVAAVLLRLAANAVNAAFDLSLSAFPLGLLIGGIVFDLCHTRIHLRGNSRLQRLSIPISLMTAWCAFLVSNNAWRRLVGRLWWEPSVLLFAVPVGGILLFLGSRFGAFLAGSMRARSADGLSASPSKKWHVSWRVAGAWTVIAAGVISLSGVPLMKDMSKARERATITQQGARMRLLPDSAAPGDWVSVFEMRTGADPRTVWLGALSRKGSFFEGPAAPPQADWILIWFQHSNRSWVTFARPAADLRAEMTTQTFRPKGKIQGWEGPVGYTMVFALTGLSSALLLFALRSVDSRRRGALQPEEDL